MTSSAPDPPPDRRSFLRLSTLALLGLAGGGGRAATPPAAGAGEPGPRDDSAAGSANRAGGGGEDDLRLFLTGDVMTGRGVDQVLPHSVDPRIHEPWIDSATAYVELAERQTGPIPRPIGHRDLWGDALAALERREPDLRIVNLETAVTARGEPAPKGIQYRMHPENAALLGAAGIDACSLANNHVLDWGPVGLLDTLRAIAEAGVATAGAGRDAAAARAPAVLDAGGGSRLLLFACGVTSSGIPSSWAAGEERPGVRLLPDLSPATARCLSDEIGAARRPRDRVVLSIHWGPNWGYAVPRRHRRFAHAVIDSGAVDVVHGHSSHHPMGIEVHRGRPILYGCGDFLNDYEGIGGHEEVRPELVLAYFPTLAADGALVDLAMAPFRLERFRPQRATEEEAGWLQRTLDRECRELGTAVELGADGDLHLRWPRRGGGSSP